MKNSKSNNKGITLIALVITIIVLVILVGVTVSVTINTGLIANSKTAVEDYGTAQENEIVALKKVESLTAPRVNGDPNEWGFDATTGTITEWIVTEENEDDTEVVIPNYINGVAVKSIGWLDQNNSSNQISCCFLTKITIPEGIENIGWYALADNDITTIDLPNSIKTIGKYAFTSCKYLESVTIPGTSGETVVEEGAFFSCGALKELIIEDGVISIGPGSFQTCKALTNITIPSTVTSIGEGAFKYDTNLKLTIKKGSSLTAESPNYPWGLEKSQITFEK